MMRNILLLAWVFMATVSVTCGQDARLVTGQAEEMSVTMATFANDVTVPLSSDAAALKSDGEGVVVTSEFGGSSDTVGLVPDQTEVDDAGEPTDFLVQFTANKTAFPECYQQVVSALYNLQSSVATPVVGASEHTSERTITFSLPPPAAVLPGQVAPSDPIESLNAKFGEDCAVFGPNRKVTADSRMLRGTPVRQQRQVRNLLQFEAQGETTVIEGSLQVTISTFDDQSDVTGYALRTADRVVELKFPTGVEDAGLETGMYLRVTGTLAAPVTIESVAVGDFGSTSTPDFHVTGVDEVVELSQTASKLKSEDTFNAQATTLSILTVSVSMCGSATVASADINAAWFTNPSNLYNYYQTISYGKVIFQSAVANSVSVCISTWNSSCDIWGLSGAVDPLLTSAGYNLNNYRTVMYITQQNPGSQCAIGTGVLNCGSGCRIWLRNDWWNRLEVPMHELGHNLGCHHAQSGTDQYGDTTCVMGYSGGGTRSFNPPHMWQLGWASPIADLTKATLPVGTSLTFSIPARSTSDVHYLRITTDWAATPTNVLWVGFITTASYDGPSNAGKVAIHQFNDPRTTATKTYLLGAIATGSWQHADSLLTVQVVSIVGTTATVTLCNPDATGFCGGSVSPPPPSPTPPPSPLPPSPTPPPSPSPLPPSPTPPPTPTPSPSPITPSPSPITPSPSPITPNPSPITPSPSPPAPSEIPVAVGDSVPINLLRIGSIAKGGSTGYTTLGSASVGVAVLDTGIQLNHPDLNVVHGYNYITNGASSDDDNGHGTHVAGIIAAKNQGSGVVGVAPGTTLYSVKVLDKNAAGTTDTVCKGLNWVATNAATLNIKVACIAWSQVGSVDTTTCLGTKDPLRAAICAVVNAGVSIVVSAGNNGKDIATQAPAAYPEVLTVTSMSDGDGAPYGKKAPSCMSATDDQYAPFSNYATTSSGAAHTVAAPGACIRSTWIGGAYATQSGSSTSAPHVAGVVALCYGGGMQSCAGKTPSQVMALVMDNAKAHATASRSCCASGCASCTKFSSDGFNGDPYNKMPTNKLPVANAQYGFMVWGRGL